MKGNFNYDLFTIDETRGEDKTGENTDNTLMKYFMPDDTNSNSNMISMRKDKNEVISGTGVSSSNTITKTDNSNNLSIEKIEKAFKKPIKLRNALKQCYWDRQIYNTNTSTNTNMNTVNTQVYLLILRIFSRIGLIYTKLKNSFPLWV